MSAKQYVVSGAVGMLLFLLLLFWLLSRLVSAGNAGVSLESEQALSPVLSDSDGVLTGMAEHVAMPPTDAKPLPPVPDTTPLVITDEEEIMAMLDKLERQYLQQTITAPGWYFAREREVNELPSDSPHPAAGRTMTTRETVTESWTEYSSDGYPMNSVGRLLDSNGVVLQESVVYQGKTVNLTAYSPGLVSPAIRDAWPEGKARQAWVGGGRELLASLPRETEVVAWVEQGGGSSADDHYIVFAWHATGYKEIPVLGYQMMYSLQTGGMTFYRAGNLLAPGGDFVQSISVEYFPVQPVAQLSAEALALYERGRQIILSAAEEK